MITVQQLVKSIRNPDKYDGLITKGQASFLLSRHGYITTHTVSGDNSKGYCISKVVFFSDDHSFGYGVLPKEWVPCTSYLPFACVPRPGLPDGVVRTVEDYITVFHDPETLVIETMEELVDYVNNQAATKE